MARDAHGRRAFQIDRWVDSNLLRWGNDGGRFDHRQRFVRDATHFAVSLLSEVRSAVAAAPGFVGELLKNGAYPDRMTYRKLPYLPERANLRMLKQKNPEWVFRPDFDPRHWVIVFLHGYIDNTGADRVAFKLASLGYQVYLIRYPFLRNVRRIAGELAETLELIAKREQNKRIVPIGHSLGGFIWDHLLLHQPELVDRHRMPLYIPMGSPHFGTLAAYLGLGQSAHQMRPRSDLVLEHLNRRLPAKLPVYPFVSRYDLLVLPIETALLRGGVNYLFSETGHIGQVIKNETVQAIEEVLASPDDVLRERAQKRRFYLSSLTWLLSRLPSETQRRLGLDGVLEYVGAGTGGAEFYIRIVHHEMRLGLLPALRR